MNTRTAIFLFLLLATASTLLRAQNSDTILPNPNAVLLRKIWMIRGSAVGGQRVGAGAGGIGNVFGDSANDVAVFVEDKSEWQVFAQAEGAIATTPIWRFENAAAIPPYPTSGNFWGTNRHSVGFPKYLRTDTGDRTRFFLKLSIFQSNDRGFTEAPAAIVDPSGTMDPLLEAMVPDVLAADLDLDGDDELILAVSQQLIDTTLSKIGEIWVYAGGPNFQVDSPTVVLKDTEANRIRYSLHIAQFDNDSFPDLLIAGDYEDNAAKKYKFFWGKPSLQQLSEHPDHSITLNNAAVGVGILPTIADLDGDHIADIAGSKLPFTPLFLSSSGKPITQRTFRMDDADHVLYTPNFYATGELGPLNDSTNQRTMLPLFGPSPLGGAMVKALSTNAAGSTTQQPIDPTYDAYYGSSYDGMAPYSVFGHGGPAGDVNGDGWSDYLTAEPSWPGSDAGIAMILAGGPYIPRDDNTTSVHDIPAEGKSAGLSVWPNPVRDLLNIAWRGDLQRMPRRFTVHSINGERIAGGMVDPGIGAAIWHCNGLSSGSYLLTAYDDHDRIIATTTISKQ